MKNLRQFAFAALAVLVLISAGFADDPPSRAVRLKYMAGQVSLQPGGVDDWVPGTINRPLTTADRVWTDKDSRAELHLGTSALRMNGETSLTLTNVSDNTVQVELDQGTLNLRVAHLYDGEIYEVDTPNLAFTITKSGDYRFDVDADGDSTQVTVWKGEGEATGDGPAVRLRSHEQGFFSGGKTLAHDIQRAPGFDGFDDWCRVRDEREDHAEAVRYVPRGVIGYEDLDGYGRWATVAPYGAVWFPAAVATGWAPYRYGHWVWVSPWGWTWVDDELWGFAPFHYGRWVHYRGVWGWCPGPIAVRPYYAPALVAWVGGSSWSISLSFGSGGGMAWFPLGYGEPYIPSYQVSRRYFETVNVSNTRITNITYVTNTYYNNSSNVTRITYVNQRINGAVTAVPRDTIINSRPVYRDAVYVDARHMKGATVIHEVDVRPSRDSMLGEHHDDRAQRPPERVMERRVVSKMPPPPPPPHPFRDERQMSDRDRDRKDDRQMSDRDRGRGDDHRAVPVREDHDRRPATAREEDSRRPDHENAGDNSRQNRPDSVSRPDVRNADERGRDVNRHVPRPPEIKNAAEKEAETPDRGNSPRNGGEPNRGARDDNSRPERNVPRPPDNRGRDAEQRNTPATPVNTPAAGNDNRPERNVPRPPDNRGRDAEQRNTPATPVNTPAAGNDNRPERNVPRPPDNRGRDAEVRNTPATPVNTPANDNNRSQRNVPRPPEAQSNNANPAPQRQAQERPVIRPAVQSSPTPTPRETRAPAPAPQPQAGPRQAAPQPQSRPSNTASRPAPAEQHHSAPASSSNSKDEKGGKPQH